MLYFSVEMSSQSLREYCLLLFHLLTFLVIHSQNIFLLPTAYYYRAKCWYAKMNSPCSQGHHSHDPLIPSAAQEQSQAGLLFVNLLVNHFATLLHGFLLKPSSSTTAEVVIKPHFIMSMNVGAWGQCPNQMFQETILTCSVFSEKNNDLFQTNYPSKDSQPFSSKNHQG